MLVVTVLQVLSDTAPAEGVQPDDHLLPGWAEATQAARPEEAAQKLTEARQIATELQSQGLDTLAADAIATIDNASPDLLPILAQGHATFGEAKNLYDAGQFTTARERFLEASALLAQAESPFALWADYHAAVVLYMIDPAGAAEAFTAIREKIGDRPYWPLIGQSHWTRGLAMRQAGLTQAPLQDYQLAQQALAKAGDYKEAAVKGLIASVYRDLGLREQAWELRLEALEVLSRAGDHRHTHNQLYPAVLALLEEGRPQEAYGFAQQAISNAEAAEHPGFLAEATRLMAKVQARLGELDEAWAQLEASRAHAAKIPNAQLREQLEGEVAATLAELLVDEDPQAAVANLDEALRIREETGYLLYAPPLYRLRAAAHGRLGDYKSQSKDLRTALRQVERRRKEPGQETYSISYWETVQDLVDDLIRFEAVTRRDAEEAYDYAEQARGRTLMDRLAADLGGSADSSFLEEGYPEESRIRKIQKRLPADAVLLEYAVLEDHLIVWWLRQKGPLDMAVLSLPREELSSRVDQLQRLVAAGEGAEQTRPVLAELFDRLVRPVAGKLKAGETLLIAPDRDLHRLPWAALFDAERQRYLLQDHSVVVLPSASLLTLDRQMRSMAKIEEGPVLVVGNPAFNRDLFTDMPSLPAAEAEAGLIEDLYPRSLLLTGHEATEEAFRQGLDGVRVIHVSGHARVSENQPLLSSLVLAPAGEADSGLLEMPEIYELPLETVELVVLAACRSVDAFPGGGREGVAGLARAFLAAGAGSVVASLWDVDDDASLTLMERFHQEFRAGKHPAQALRDAQLALLESDDPRLQSPALWAGFQTISATPP